MKKIILALSILLSMLFVGCTSIKDSIPGTYIPTEFKSNKESFKAVNGIIPEIGKIKLLIKKDGSIEIRSDYNGNKDNAFGKWYEENGKFFMEMNDDPEKMEMNYNNSELILTFTEDTIIDLEDSSIEFKFKKVNKK